MRHDLDVLTETRFHGPDLRKEWVERAGLLHRLTATGAKLVLVEAPAGYGKTILVAQWRARLARAVSVAWVSVDEADNEPRKLWWHITHALLRACPELDGDRMLSQLEAGSPDIAGQVVPVLANELASLAAPVVLVLDDYHAIRERACHEQVTFLLHHIPASVQVVLVTRADPPLPLARWRANGEMAEFRADDLRLTSAEAAQVVCATSGAELSEPDLAMLVDRTEGWPAGLYLAALSLRGHDSPAVFVRQFTGASPFIADFMAEEVLSRQPAAIRRFLARTSILGRFCAPLCDAVTDSADAAQVLAALERENVFIVPLDDTRQWFRYHHLFAQVLRRELDRAEPGLVPVLHRRASAWYRPCSTDEAVEHAIAADDRADAIGLIASYWYPRVASGQAATVRGWLRRLGEQAIGADPVAAHCAAWSAASAGDRESVRRWLPVMAASTREGPLPDGMGSLESSVALLQGCCGFDGLKSMSESAERAAELERDASLPWHALARTALGLSRYLSGDPAGAEKPLLEAVGSQALTPEMRVASLSALSLTSGELGQTRQAQHGADQVFSIMTSSNLSQAPSASLAHAAVGAAQVGLGRLHEGRRELERALHMRRRVPGISVWVSIDIMLRLANVLADLADRSPAAALAEEAGLMLAAGPDDAAALRARLERLERRLGSWPGTMVLATPLTEREISVLQLLRSELTLREIAAELDLSVNTIKTQVQSIYRKLGVSTRLNAIRRGRQAGLL